MIPTQADYRVGSQLAEESLAARRPATAYDERFGVVVQADEFLPRSVVIVVPTSRRARAASFRTEIDVAGQRRRVLVEQIGAVDDTDPPLRSL
jgi:mRNA-degrading endonuclease toxin of MazEF toxin-antitoxin module